MRKKATKAPEGEPGKGRRIDPIRWSIGRAADEFGLDKNALSGRLKRAGTEPGSDGFFSTHQIAAAVYGDLEFERIRKTKAEADGIEMQNRKIAGELVDLSELSRKWEPVFIDVKRIVLGSKLADNEKDELLGRLAEVVK